jgi:hypothetical protein
MNPTYRVINKSDNKVVSMRHANKVSALLLGRRLGNYIIIKSTGGSDDVFVPSCSDVTVLERELEEFQGYGH